MVPQISNKDLKAELDKGASLLLLDVRKPHELENGTLTGVINIPMNEVAERLSELDPTVAIVVVCRSGGRSGTVSEYLVSQGFTNVRNLVGGMNGWSSDIDSNVKFY